MKKRYPVVSGVVLLSADNNMFQKLQNEIQFQDITASGNDFGRKGQESSLAS